jgi:KaiC/GvpD/RAD55 family RecA-like ATPase
MPATALSTMETEYELAVESAPTSITGGTALLLLHPSIGETDRIDTQFLKNDTDRMLVISTRTTAREVAQKLEHYEVDASRATILDTVSAERGYTRRQSDDVRYIARPEHLDGIVDEAERFLEETAGKRRLSLDSITEMIYYTDRDRTRMAVESLLTLLEAHDAVGLFHLAVGVHDETVVEEFRSLFDGVIELDEEGSVSTSMAE